MDKQAQMALSWGSTMTNLYVSVISKVPELLQTERLFLGRLIFKHQQAHRRKKYIIQARRVKRWLDAVGEIDICKIYQAGQDIERLINQQINQLKNDTLFFKLKSRAICLNEFMMRGIFLTEQCREAILSGTSYFKDLLQREFFVPMCMLFLSSLARINELCKNLQRFLACIKENLSPFLSDRLTDEQHVVAGRELSNLKTEVGLKIPLMDYDEDLGQQI